MKRRPGKFYKHAVGFKFWYPDGWTLQDQGDWAVLTPSNPGSNAHGPTEAYLIFGEHAVGMSSPQDPQIVQYLDQSLQSLAPFLRRKGPVSSVGMGATRGAMIEWEGSNPRNEKILARTYVCLINSYAVALLEMGHPHLVAKRDPDVRAMFGSFGFEASQKDPRLAGTWEYSKHSSFDGAYGASSSSTSTEMTLNQDGTFRETSSSTFDMDHMNDRGEVEVESENYDLLKGKRGRWSAAGGQLRMFYDDGSAGDYKYKFDGGVLILEADGAKWLYMRQ